MDWKFTILLALLFLSPELQSQPNDTFTHIGDYDLDNYGAFGLLDMSDQHLVFIEFYTLELQIFNIKEGLNPEDLSDGLIKKKFRKGRGPDELLMVNSMDVHQNMVLIGDVSNSKILIYDIETDEIREMHLEKHMPYMVEFIDQNNFLLADYTKAGNIFHRVNLNSGSIIQLENLFDNPYKERLRIFSEEGFFTSGRGKHYFFKRYIPKYFEISDDRVQIAMQYEDVDIGKPKVIEYNSQKAFTPPPVSLLCNDAAFLSPTKFLLLIESNDAYKSDVLYMYDAETEEITPFLDLENSPMEIASNNLYLVTLTIYMKGGKNNLSFYKKK